MSPFFFLFIYLSKVATAKKVQILHLFSPSSPQKATSLATSEVDRDERSNSPVEVAVLAKDNKGRVEVAVLDEASDVTGVPFCDHFTVHQRVVCQRVATTRPAMTAAAMTAAAAATTTTTAAAKQQAPTSDAVAAVAAQQAQINGFVVVSYSEKASRFTPRGKIEQEAVDGCAEHLR